MLAPAPRPVAPRLPSQRGLSPTLCLLLLEPQKIFHLFGPDAAAHFCDELATAFFATVDGIGPVSGGVVRKADLENAALWFSEAADAFLEARS
jgi:hypothetical protein